MDKKTISIVGVLALIISIGTNISIDKFSPNEYLCEDRLELGSYPCESFTSYYSLENGKCINSETGNKLCRSGWVEIVDEKIPDETVIEYNIKVNYNGRDWYCESNEPYAKCERDGTHTAYYSQLR